MRLEYLARRCQQGVELVPVERDEQVLAGGEVPVQRALTHPGAPGQCLHRDLVRGLQGGLRRGQDLLPVPLGVGPQVAARGGSRTVSARHVAALSAAGTVPAR